MTAFDRDQLLAALNEIGAAAVTAHKRLDIAVFGGSALMLAGNFRFSTEDVDIAEIGRPWPDWLSIVVAGIAKRNGWSEHWFNDAVGAFLSPLARSEKDFVFLGTFPRATEHAGLRVFVPTARYMLALKLKLKLKLKLEALRVSKFDKGTTDIADVGGPAWVLGITNADDAIAVMTEFFPNSPADVDKARFVLRHILATKGAPDAPRYPGRDL
jgi:hypothetical protein